MAFRRVWESWDGPIGKTSKLIWPPIENFRPYSFPNLSFNTATIVSRILAVCGKEGELAGIRRAQRTRLGGFGLVGHGLGLRGMTKLGW